RAPFSRLSFPHVLVEAFGLSAGRPIHRRWRRIRGNVALPGPHPACGRPVLDSQKTQETVMVIAALFRDVLGKKRSSPGRHSLPRRPTVEALEQREVPATLVLPQTSLPTFTATFTYNQSGNPTTVTSHAVSGGNFLGTLNGNIPLTASYCVNIELNIFP